MIYVIATTDVKPGMREKFLEIFNAMVPTVRQEKGCIMYQPNIDFPSGLSAQNPVSDTLVTIIEGCESMDALKAHLGAPHMKTYRELTKDMVQGKTLNVVEPADCGNK